MDAATMADHWRRRVRRAMPVEGDLAFRRRCETVLEFLDVRPDDRVLDVGCGYGFYLRLIPELTGASIVGVDIEQERLDFARSRLGDDDRISYVRASVLDLPFANQTFGHVICSEVLEHLPDDRGALREIHRVLRPGGRLVITVPSRQYPVAWDPVNAVLERLTGRHLGGERFWSGIWYGHLRLYDQPQLQRRLVEAGFVIDETRPLSHFVPPFAHLILYGLLKPLLLRGLLPLPLARSGDRFATTDQDDARPGRLVTLAMRILNRIDRPNDDAARMARKHSFVALAVRGYRPE